VRFRLTQSRLYASGRDWMPALNSMDQAIRNADVESRHTVAERALELHRSILAEPPPASVQSEVRDQRERLELRFPTDPLVSVDLARTDLKSWSTTPDRGLSKAMRRLERLRAFTEGMPIENLRRGATRLWFGFLLEFDARAAGRFALEELRLRPFAADLWRMLAEANEAQGARAGAIEVREFLQKSLPDATDARALVRLLAQSGRDLDAFERAFTGCLVQEDLLEPDADLLLERARFQVESGAQAWPSAAALLAELWRDHAVPHLLPPAPTPSVEGEAAPILLSPDEERALRLPMAPWQPGTTPVEIERALGIARLRARLIAWMGRPEDAATLDELALLLERTDDDRLALEVLAAQRALAPRPPGDEPGG
jgi:tetratricopeptide (TPR) repeat protein